MHGTSTRISARALAGALLVGAGLLVAAPTANAQCAAPAAVTTLTDGTGYVWDIRQNGTILNGSIDAYDVGFSLIVNSTYFPADSTPTTELSGRQYAFGPATMSGLEVTRRVYVPTGEGWARFLEYFHNPTAASITATVEVQTNLGSDSGTVITGSSDGDTVFETTDTWVATDDATDGSGDPSLVQVIAWSGASPSAVSTTVYDCTGTQGVLFRYIIEVPAGATRILMHAGAQNANRATSFTRGAYLAGEPASLLYGITPADVSLLVNADNDTDADGVPDLSDNCPSVANPSQTDTDGNGIGDACQQSNSNSSDGGGCGAPGDALSLLAVVLLPLLARRRGRDASAA